MGICGFYLGVEMAVVLHAPALYAALGGLAAFVGLLRAPAEFVVSSWTSHIVPAFLNFERGILAKGGLGCKWGCFHGALVASGPMDVRRERGILWIFIA